MASIMVFLGCRSEPASTLAPSPAPKSDFEFRIDEVFYIRPPVDRVMLVGVVLHGTTRTGDSGVLTYSDGELPVAIEAIEAIRIGEIEKAVKGDQVALRVQGVDKDKVSAGDRISASPDQAAPRD
jgi:translation elongation factor EF-1alpha